jgi:predicted ATP-grasp superfamily ATP-dependent carboligase
MVQQRRILLFGASTRAAAFSALRAGLGPWCADLFADRDLKQCCDVRSARGKYPGAYLEMLHGDPPGPWMYTGGLENHPRLVAEMSRLRKLWGNDAGVLKRARNPQFVADALRTEGLPCPAVAPGGGMPSATVWGGRRWLVKPLRGAGGHGIAFWTEDQPRTAGRNQYVQEFIDGDAVAAIYLADVQSVELLGLTRQLVGSAFCHARRFQYCGSIGALEISQALRAGLQRVGEVLTAACQLRGLFGVDGVLRDDTFWPVEVNPRYTASVEVLEYATGLPALGRHAAAFDPEAPRVVRLGAGNGLVGKAICMARRDLVFPAAGPWDSALRKPAPLEEMPDFADIPERGEHIKAGRPVLTLFARCGSLAGCADELHYKTVDLDRWLYGS